MPVMSSSVITDRAQSGGQRKIREEHTDNIGVKHHRQFIAASDYDEAAGLITGASSVDASLVASEIASAVSTYEQGGDPLHYEASANNWQKITPNHQTWDELAAAVLINFLSREDRNELHYIESTIVRISTNDTKALLGMTNTEVNAVNSEIQNAVNAMAELDAYTPFFVDGVKV